MITCFDLAALLYDAQLQMKTDLKVHPLRLSREAHFNSFLRIDVCICCVCGRVHRGVHAGRVVAEAVLCPCVGPWD